MSPDRGPVPIRASLEKLLSGLGSPEIDSMTMLVERWPEVVGERLIVVRSHENKIKVLSNVCRHRGVILVEGAGNNRYSHVLRGAES